MTERPAVRILATGPAAAAPKMRIVSEVPSASWPSAGGSATIRREERHTRPFSVAA
jgi:hypothetical protein